MKNLSEFQHRINVGHVKKAEKILNALISNLSIDELKTREAELRGLTTTFLPKHKTRHSRTNLLISSRLSFRNIGSTDLSESVIPNSGRGLSTTESKESQFRMLLDEIKELRFDRSDQVSDYIKNRELGRKYDQISGILMMERDGKQWPFPYGIDPKYYGRLCRELELGNKNTDAIPGEFKPFSEL
jgi:hypothetical protein